MTKLTISPKKGDKIEIMSVRDVTFDFQRGVVHYNFDDEGGPQHGEHALDLLDDIDWSVAENTAEFGAHLTTYQFRAMANLPPKLVNAPDLTYDPVLPKRFVPSDNEEHMKSVAKEG